MKAPFGPQWTAQILLNLDLHGPNGNIGRSASDGLHEILPKKLHARVKTPDKILNRKGDYGAVLHHGP